MNLFSVDESSQLPIWVQVRNRFAYLIKSGYYKPGDQLPSVRSLAAEAAVNYNTVSKAYVDLEHSGYVKSVRGRGVFVLAQNEGEEDDVSSTVEAEIEACIRNCMAMGLTLDEVRLRMMDVTYKVQRSVDPEDSLRRSLQERDRA